MSGFFGVISKTDCVGDMFYGTDYHSHLGTKRAGMVFIVPGKGFRRSIHNLEGPPGRRRGLPAGSRQGWDYLRDRLQV